MNQFGKFLGVLTRLVKKEGSTYLTGWVETPNGSEKFFHQNFLKNAEDLKLVEIGTFVEFNVKLNKTKTGEREDAVDVTILDEEHIKENIEQYDNKEIAFVFKHAGKNLRGEAVRITNELEKRNKDLEILSKREETKQTLPRTSQATKSQVTGKEGNLPLPSLDESKAKTFLEVIFKTNSEEYNLKLFQVLVDGIKCIDNQDLFQQAKFLLKYNEVNNTIRNLNSQFYDRASDEFKFRLWFDQLTDYCSTDILKSYFEKAGYGVKSEIIRRCNGDENGFLVLKSRVMKASGVENVYFSNIKEKLLRELSRAKRSISIAVAWFTNDDLFDMLCMKLKQGIKVELIIINDYINNWDFGLPFQTFIDLKGKLYLSEYPSIMHHKFCLIDDDTIFNGSYNWTYYAEMRNDENIMMFKEKPNLTKEFKGEFERLKLELGEPVSQLQPFDSSQIIRFERNAFRQYFSTDLTLRAAAVRKINISRADELTTKAIDVDAENVAAKNLSEELKSEVQLQQRIIRVQNIIGNETGSTSRKYDEQKEVENLKYKLSDVLDKEAEQNLQDNDIELDRSIVVDKPGTPNYGKAESNVSSSNINQRVGQQAQPLETHSSYKLSTKIASSSNILLQNSNQLIPEALSVPKQEPIKKQFKNLKVAVALDISGSMDVLYKNGVVQVVVEKLLAVALSISTLDQLDIWTFNDKFNRLTSVTKSNFHNYIGRNGISSGGGTNVLSVLTDIDKRYFNEGTGNNVFGIILTDGDIGDLQNFISTSTKKPIFWQFVGLGSDFAKLDTLNRANHNTSFFSLNDINAISDEDLYKKLLSEFPRWYIEGEKRGFLN